MVRPASAPKPLSVDTQPVVLVTGASAGIGNKLCEKLLAQQYIVYAAARRTEKMRNLAQQGAHILYMDVTEDNSVADGIAQLWEEQKRIDVLVNNAGYGCYASIESLPLSDIQRQYEVNVFGCARLIQAVLPHMRAQLRGRIINTSSIVSHFSAPILGWYASSKHALKAMTDALRMEVKDLGIHVILIEPGAIKTEFDQVAFSILDRIDHPQDYTQLVKKFRQFVEQEYANCPDGEGTVNAIMRAITAKHPQIRYTTTWDAKLLPIVKHCLGDRWFDWVILKTLTSSK